MIKPRRSTPVVGVLGCALALSLLSGCALSRRGASRPCGGENEPEGSFIGLYKQPQDTAAYQDYAEHAFLYAQMADNAYPRARPFVLPDSIRPVRQLDDSSGTGFSATVFEIGAVGALHSVVLAFRGTEGPIFVSRDWRNGNWRRRQQLQALALYAETREMYTRTVPISATGHSLGGALAIQASMADSNVLTYVFNTSYRVIFRGMTGVSPRVSLAETGEILGGVRVLLPNVTILHLPGYDCTQGGPLANHEMTRFARCLTRIAAARRDGAIESLRRNPVPCPVAAVRQSSPGFNEFRGM